MVETIEKSAARAALAARAGPQLGPSAVGERGVDKLKTGVLARLTALRQTLVEFGHRRSPAFTAPSLPTGSHVGNLFSESETRHHGIVVRNGPWEAHLLPLMDDDFSFGERLVDARRVSGLNQQQLLAKLGGTAQSTLSSWETGKTQPSVEDVRKLARAIGCTADFLLGLSASFSGLRPGDWLVDLDRVDMVRRKETPPDHGRFAWPIPDRHRIISARAYADLEDDLRIGKRKGRT